MAYYSVVDRYLKKKYKLCKPVQTMKLNPGDSSYPAISAQVMATLPQDINFNIGFPLSEVNFEIDPSGVMPDRYDRYLSIHLNILYGKKPITAMVFPEEISMSLWSPIKTIHTDKQKAEEFAIENLTIKAKLDDGGENIEFEAILFEGKVGEMSLGSRLIPISRLMEQVSA